MRKVMRTNRELAHVWAAQTQSEGSCSNYYFEGAYLYSYGKHFCVGRILPNGTACMTTRTYGQATSKHLSYARQAITHMGRVYCHDPSESATQNKVAVVRAMQDALKEAGTPRRIKEHTRIAHRARALKLGQDFNAYLTALPVEEQGTVTFIDTSDLDQFAADLEKAEREKLERVKAAQEKQKAEALANLERWKRGSNMVSQMGFHHLPVALRLTTLMPSTARNLSGGLIDPLAADKDVIQTSHGASIPAGEAKSLWDLIQNVKAGVEVGRVERRLGSYMLNQIDTSRNIKVGCHLIGYDELERMAKAMGFV